MNAKTVLLVEDDYAIRDVMQDVLENHGYDVVPAANGKQAIDYLTSTPVPKPDVVVLDLMVPIVTGWQVIETMRREGRLQQVPVIVVSAVTQDKPAGAVAFLRKPVRLNELLETVDAHTAR